ncbi:hypothetical protein B296_00019182 [Ensete ventricosum]|uniref:Uncharacterized protein n=1 Tax=Ensete ventricosum TaxID=4639 RepID=A0A427AKI1_ENSVE|nr:hypothetical protein B296_00019182 [Ensete ventricosum]
MSDAIIWPPIESRARSTQVQWMATAWGPRMHGGPTAGVREAIVVVAHIWNVCCSPAAAPVTCYFGRFLSHYKQPAHTMDSYSVDYTRAQGSACVEIKNESWPLDRHRATHIPSSVIEVELEFQLFLWFFLIASSASLVCDRVGSAAARVTTMFLRQVMLRGGMGAAWMQAAGKVKETTEIVGLDVVPNAREVLVSLYSRTLKEIQAVPQDEGYRKAVESFTRHRLQVCQEEEDWEAIEKRIGCGQVEELIEEAQDELKLIAKMIGSSVFSIPSPHPAFRSQIFLPVSDHYGDLGIFHLTSCDH